MTTQYKQIFVLTGDFIASEKLSSAQLDEAIQIVSDIITAIAGDSIKGFARNRGDGWQTVVSSHIGALRLALLITAALSERDASYVTRIAIGGGGALGVIPDDLNAATGPSFTASGRALDRLTGDRRITHASGGALDACARLSDAIAQTWTRAQARTALHLLHPDRPTRAEVAKRLGISRQAVDKSAHGAQLPAILDALEMIEAAP